MTIREPTSSGSFLFSHRTLPEQLVGLGIYLAIGSGLSALSGLFTSSSFIYGLFLSLGMWSLWRKFSLRVLKLELSLFLAQFVLQFAWSASLFLAHQSLLALVALLLLSCNTLVATLLFWQKQRYAGFFYLFPLLWVSYLTCMNMISCISNP